MNTSKINLTKIISFLKEPFLLLFFIAFFLLLCFFSIIDLYVYDKLNEFWKSLLLNAHTILLDILLFGVLVSIFNSRQSNRQNQKEIDERIMRHREELEDFRLWQSEEAKHRIIGIIKRLNEFNITQFSLRRSYLNNADFRRIINLSNSDLRFANLQDADLYSCICANVNFTSANLKGACLRRTIIQGANLTDAELDGAKVFSIDWIEKLKEQNVIGGDQIAKVYYVSSEEKVFRYGKGENEYYKYFEVMKKTVA